MEESFTSGSSFSRSLDLARKARDADEQAKILEGFRPFLKRIANQLIGAKYAKRLDASDVVQSAIIGALDDFSGCRAANETEFKAWLRQLLVHDVMNKLRYLNREKRDISRETAISDFGKLRGNQASPEEVLVAKENVSRLNEALEKLLEPERQVIVLRNQEKLRFAEIGRRMSRSEDAARMLWTRSIQKLAKILNRTD